MTPGKLDLTFVRGDDFFLPNRLRSRNLDGTPGAYRDIFGWTAESEIWKDGAKVADIEVYIDPNIEGRFTLSAARTVTESVPSSGCTWFLRLIDLSDKANTWLIGRVLVRLPGDSL